MLEIMCAIFIIILGCLGHFIYEWSNHNKLIGYFFAVNESTWEHIKLAIGPSLIWFILEIHVYSGNDMLMFSKLISILVMMILIPILFYTYTHFTKKSILIVDIISFIIAVIVGEYIFHVLININYSSVLLNHIGIIGLIVIFILYLTSTYTPYKNFIYKDPITKKYGIDGHSHHEHHNHK